MQNNKKQGKKIIFDLKDLNEFFLGNAQIAFELNEDGAIVYEYDGTATVTGQIVELIGPVITDKDVSEICIGCDHCKSGISNLPICTIMIRQQLPWEIVEGLWNECPIINHKLGAVAKSG